MVEFWAFMKITMDLDLDVGTDDGENDWVMVEETEKLDIKCP